MPAATSLDTPIARPGDSEQLIALVRDAARSRQAIYPVGGNTSVRYGMPPLAGGLQLELGDLQRVIDYPSADMTITVEAGITMGALAGILAAKGQRLPLDVPQAKEATLGGVLATNSSGPLRFGHGTARDYVIGIRAVDGRGESFAGGGRVVKNVAGYDFCKLLVGSLGTLAIITEVTLKLKPLAFGERLLVCAPRDRDECDRMLAHLMTTAAQPVAIEWLLGPAWQEQAVAQQWPGSSTADASRGAGWLVLLLEGSTAELDWMTSTLQAEWRQQFASSSALIELPEPSATATRTALTEFAAQDSAATVKLQTVPSAVVSMAQMFEQSQIAFSLQAHAGNGTLIVSFPQLPASGLSRPVLQQWQPAAYASGGNLVFLAAPAASDHTPRIQWGVPSGPLSLMQKIKEQFDPYHVLNPQRYFFT